MKIIVVLNRSSVLVVDLGNKLEELVMINSLKQVIVLEQRRCHKGHLHVAANRFGELENVEVEVEDFLVETSMLEE
jgi:recombinational DNA repair protein RecR